MIGEHIYESFDKNEVVEFQKAINPDYWERAIRVDPETMKKVYILSWTIIDPERCERAWKHWRER